jgi:FtsH-binding integral membrane protein
MAEQPPPPSPPPPPAVPPAAGLPERKPGPPGLAIAGFVVGVVGLLICWLPIAGLIVGLVGLALSFVGQRQAQEKDAPAGLATAGIICSILAVLVGIVFTVLWVTAVDEIGEKLDDITFTTTTKRN